MFDRFVGIGMIMWARWGLGIACMGQAIAMGVCELDI